MAKSKKQELIPSTAKKKKRFVANEVDLLGDDDDWVVVKKQKVTILIPPSPVSNHVTTPDPAETLQQPRLTKAVETQTQSKCKTGTPTTHIHSSHEMEKSKSLTPEKTSLDATPIFLPDHKPEAQKLHVDSSKGRTITNVCSYPKVIKRLAISIDRNRLLNQRLRAVILEKKLKRAGGLRNWLVSIGLSCFVKIFQFKHVSKFHLASLTMERLKDMGAYPVGPRRKLLHAIDCLCQPYCFEHT